MGVSPWAAEEMATADFGDERLDARAAVVLSAMGERPNLSIPAACGGLGGGHNEVQAAYRFFDNDKVTFGQVLVPHVRQTLRRMADHPVVLLTQDTTEVDLTRPRQQVEGVGDLGQSRKGLLLHVLHAFTPAGLPLGTLRGEVINRTQGVSHAPTRRKQRKRKHTPIERKESLRWLSGLREARGVAGELPQVRCVCLADSEGDIYECFAEPRGEPRGESAGTAAQTHWIIRACQDRALEDNSQGESEGEEGQPHRRLRERVLANPVLYELDLMIREREPKTAAETRARRQTRRAREARVQVRAATVTLRPPWREDRQLPEVTVNVVLVHEPAPPQGESPVEWVLITTLPIDTPDDVRKVVEYYCVRWSVEVFFRTLKSGCRVERRRFEDVRRVLPCLAMCLVMAWRTMYVCRCGGDCPEADCEAVFEPCEWKSVWAAVHRKKPPKDAKDRPRLREMVRLVARLGGYVERPGAEPGVQSMWIGLSRMSDLALAWQTFGPGAAIDESS